MPDTVIATFAAIFLACLVCQWVAWRVKLPAILFLLFAGIVAGPFLGILHPDQLLGDLLFPFVSLSVAVILFEGSLTLKYREIAGLRKVVQSMVSLGMLVTWLVTAVATRVALNFSWEVCFLFGAVTVVTGPTVIVPMLRTVRPNASVSNVLRWEGIIIDPIGASLAVLVYGFIISGSGSDAFGHTIRTFLQIIAVGALLGASGGYLFGLALRNHWLPEYLHNFASLCLVFTMFAASNLLQHESGLVTVTVMGIWLANMRGVDVNEILNFKESLSVLLISLLFIVLAGRMDLNAFLELGWKAVFIFLAIQFLARPLNVMLSTLGSRLTWPERHLLAWIAPRGIVAAAIAALFGLQLEKAGYEEAHFLVPLTFMVIVGTVLLQSATASFIARWLGVAEPEPRGLLIVGANRVARAIAEALVKHGFRAIVAESNWDNVSKAKMAGLDTYYGNPISDHADRNLDLVGIGRMLALSHHESQNLLAVIHYRMELGADGVFILQSKAEENVSAKLRIAARRRGQTLFGKDVTYNTLSATLSRGGEIRSTRLSENFGFQEYLEKNRDRVIPLFALDPREGLHVFTVEKKVKPGPGWTIVSIAEPDEDVPQKEGKKTG